MVESIERSARVDFSFRNYEIHSVVDGQPYMLWQQVCSHEENGWFGFRATGQCNYSNFCSAYNMNVTLKYLPNLTSLNHQLSGFSTINFSPC